MIRKLWAGGTGEHFGRHYTVDNARIYSRLARAANSAASGPPAATTIGGGSVGRVAP